MNPMRKNYGLGVNITPDLVNDFFSLKPKNQPAIPKYVKHTAGSSLMTGTTSGAMTPGNAFNINDVNYFEEQLTLGNMSDEELEPHDELSEFLLPEPVDCDDKPGLQEMSTEVYDNYSFRHKYDEGLTITAERDHVLQTIEANRVTIIEGSTGSGKTTQVPQYILDHYQQKRKFCNILVTQPRKIAAITVAKRVAQERNWPLDSLVGYQVARDRKVSEDTRITYLTTGVLLQKLIQNKHLNDYTHIILDEVHERDQDIDFSMLVVRYYLKTVSKHVKVVLMSATADCSLFSNYFSILINNRKEGAPVISVGGKMHEVHEYYFEDLTGLTDPPQQIIYEPDITDKCYKLCRELIMKLDYDETGGTEYEHGRFPDVRGTVLCFLPGVPEIKNMQGFLSDLVIKRNLKVMPLHSKISNREQGLVFDLADKGQRKVILSTNIAESSITVPDIKYVIDFCLTKETETDRDTRYQKLVLQWASKASLTQRRGRAGRVSDGHCFRLISRRMFDELIDYSSPEMLRAPLEQLILHVKLLDLGPSPSMILQLALQPPRVGDIKSTILMLKEVGAITIQQNGKVNPLDGDLTFVGRVLGKLPIDVHLGKLLLVGYTFGVLEECLIIAACLSLKSIFTVPHNQELKAYTKKMQWAEQTSCDMLASLNAFLHWKYRKINRGFGKQEWQWAREQFLEGKRFHEVDILIEDLRKRLLDFNIQTHRKIYERERIEPDDLLILKLVIAGAFYPNYFQSQDVDEADATKSMNGFDPSTTVVVHGAPNTINHYTSKVLRLFRTCGIGEALHFDSSRIFVEFKKHPNSDSTIEPAVYSALKMRDLQMSLSFLVSKKRDEELRLLKNSLPNDLCNPETGLRTNRLNAKLNLERQGNKVEFSVTCESKQVKLKESGYFDILVHHVISPGLFWGTYGDDESRDILHQIHQKINVFDGKNLQVLDGKKIVVGALVVAHYIDSYYRGKIIEVSEECIKVFFVDFGNTEEINDVEKIRRCPAAVVDYSFQAFECGLSEISPIENQWSHDAIESFKAWVLFEENGNQKIIAKIYSQYHNKYRLSLFIDDININRLLIEENYAIYKEEPLMSRSRHEEMKNVSQTDYKKPIAKAYVEDVIDEPDPEEEVMKVNLRGPFSPYKLGFSSLTRVGRTKSVRVERDSVNSILVSDQQEVKSLRFLVAATVTMNPTGSVMNARETCLLPNIPGLLSMLVLVFAPQIELRSNKGRTHYTGVLCGLGPGHRTQGDGILDSNDMEIQLETTLENNDIALINATRRTINEVIGFSHEKVDHSHEVVSGLQTIARGKILDLVHRRRESKELEQYPHEYQWNDIDKNLFISCKYDTHPDQLLLYVDAIFFQEKKKQVDQRVQDRRDRLHRFHQLAGDSVEHFPHEVVCPVCDVVCRHPRGLYLHCETRHHKQWTEAIFEDV